MTSPLNPNAESPVRRNRRLRRAVAAVAICAASGAAVVTTSEHAAADTTDGAWAVCATAWASSDIQVRLPSRIGRGQTWVSYFVYDFTSGQTGGTGWYWTQPVGHSGTIYSRGINAAAQIWTAAATGRVVMPAITVATVPRGHYITVWQQRQIFVDGRWTAPVWEVVDDVQC